jgi:hypothetical protein
MIVSDGRNVEMVPNPIVAWSRKHSENLCQPAEDKGGGDLQRLRHP